MSTIIMNQDVHTPAFIKADASNKTNRNRQQPTSPKQVRRFSWTRFIELVQLKRRTCLGEVGCCLFRLVLFDASALMKAGV